MTLATLDGSKTRSLADALPKVDLDGRLSRQRHLGIDYVLDQSAESGGAWTLSMRASPRTGPWLHAQCQDNAMGLQMYPHLDAVVGERNWQDYPSDARLLAWSLAHGPALDALGQLLESELSPLKLVSAPLDITNSLAGPVLEFTWQPTAKTNDGEPAPAWRGALAVDDTTLSALLDRATAQPRARKEKAWQGVPIALAIRCEGPQVAADTLVGCVPGDVIVLGQRSAFLQRMTATNPDGLPLPVSLAMDGEAVRVSTKKESQPMTQPTQAPDGDQIPVRLAVQTAAVDVRLSDLDGLEAGVILPLDAPVAGTNVTILANGAPVGEGELVAAGDKLAVCITRWRPDGL